MKITLALPGIDGLFGGLRVVAQYSRHLVAQGHEITLAVRRPSLEPGRKKKLLNMLGLGGPASGLPADRGHFTGLDIPVIHLKETCPVRPADLPDADLVVSTWWSTAEWANRLPARKGRHVHFIQGYEDFSEFYRKRVIAVYSQNNHKLVVSSWLRKKIKDDFGKNSKIVTNGVDVSKFRTERRDRIYPGRIGFVYSSHFVKNCSLALEALSLVAQERSDLEFIAFGHEARPETFPEWISYERQPQQNRIARIYASCDLWLFTSTAEGFGLPILEAMASRTPVLATPAGAAPDLIDGTNGRLASFDSGHYARAILDFLDQSDTAWKAASDSAWQTAQAHDLESAAHAFENALIGILAGNG